MAKSSAAMAVSVGETPALSETTCEKLGRADDLVLEVSGL